MISNPDDIRTLYIARYSTLSKVSVILLSCGVLAYLAFFVSFLAFLPSAVVSTDEFGMPIATSPIWDPMDVFKVLAIMVLIPVPFVVFVFHLTDALSRKLAGRQCRPQNLIVWIRRFKNMNASYAGFQQCLESACLGLSAPVTVYDSNLSWPPTQLLAHNPLASAAISCRDILIVYSKFLFIAWATFDVWTYAVWMLSGQSLVGLSDAMSSAMSDISNQLDGKPASTVPKHFYGEASLNHFSAQLIGYGILLFVFIAIVAAILNYKDLGSRIEFYFMRAAEVVTGMGFLTEIRARDVELFLGRLASGTQMSTGVHVVRCQRQDWKSVVSELLRSADRVILTGDDVGEGGRWELNEALKYLTPDKILIPIFTPVSGEGDNEIEEAVRMIDREGMEPFLRSYLQDPILGTSLGRSGRVMNIAYAEDAIRSWIEGEGP